LSAARKRGSCSFRKTEDAQRDAVADAPRSPLPSRPGYLRNFERDYVVGKDVPSRKYKGYEVEVHGLMADSRWRSEHQRRFDSEAFKAHQDAQPNGTTRLNPSHKDSRQAARIVAATQVQEEKEAWNWQGGSAGGVQGAQLVPRAGRGRNLGSPVYGTTYGDGIGLGHAGKPSPIHPKYPHPKTQFVKSTDSLPALDSTLNKSLAQAIASLPAADNILKGNVDVHGSYARDFGHRGHHPLQRSAGHAGGPPLIQASTLTAGSASNTYPLAPPTHVHLFPSASLIGPSGAKAGPSPIEGLNEYAHTAYTPSVTRDQPASLDANPFLRGSRIGDNLCEVATTKELFAGSTKANVIRIPGYAGHIPMSENNQLALTGLQASPTNQSHLLATFTHDLPAYTGHQPRCVVNVRGPRTPRGKKRMNESLVASLVLDSMKI
jgi:hypothetical protein